MPNWCQNWLTIRGESKDISSFRKKAAKKPPYWDYDDDHSKEVLHFSNFITPPIDLVYEEQTFEEPRKRRRYNGDNHRSMEIVMLVSTGRGEGIIPYNLYDWEFINWGCKWGGSDSILVIDKPDKLRYEFNTPWDPPIPFIKNVCKMYPKLEFNLQFDEPSNQIGGYIMIHGGKEVGSEFLQGEAYEKEYGSEEDQED